MDRRRFLRTVVGEPAAMKSELSEKPHLRLDGLGRLPDSDLASLVPVIPPHVRLTAKHGVLTARSARGGESTLSFKETDRELHALLDHFGGQATLGEISIELAEQLSWDVERAFQFARTAFLELSRCGVCVPMNQVATVQHE